jgi:hypothetical protein
MTAKIAECLPNSADINYIRARILRQSKLNEYIIIDNKVGDDHRSEAENPMAHALSSQWPFGKSKLDLKKSSLRRVRSRNLKIVPWRAALIIVVGVTPDCYRVAQNFTMVEIATVKFFF